MTAQPKTGYSEISPKQLMRLIGTPDCPVILDVCLPEDVAAMGVRIPTSIPASHEHLPDLKGRDVIVVCQKGKKLSHGAAAKLRAQGIKAEALAGGMVAWIASSLPCIPMDRAVQGTTWVTRHRPKIDRIACPWLIRRFVDPTATFLFVPPSEVMAVADRFDAIAFDTPKAPFTHKDAHCTFDVLLDHFDLRTDALIKMAQVIRAADTDTHASSPQAAGLLAVSVGLSRMYKDDLAQLDAALPLYDALYRWARDGQNETHDWDNEAQQ